MTPAVVTLAMHRGGELNHFAGGRWVSIERKWFGWVVDSHNSEPAFFHRRRKAFRRFDMLCNLTRYVAEAMSGK